MFRSHEQIKRKGAHHINIIRGSECPHRELIFPLKKPMRLTKDANTSKNQSYRAKKSGRPNKSETAPSAIGIVPKFPPLNTLVRRLLALSRRFLFVFGSPTSVDWHLHKHFTGLPHKQQVPQHNHILPPSSNDPKQNNKNYIKFG